MRIQFAEHDLFRIFFSHISVLQFFIFFVIPLRQFYNQLCCNKDCKIKEFCFVFMKILFFFPYHLVIVLFIVFLPFWMNKHRSLWRVSVSPKDGTLLIIGLWIIMKRIMLDFYLIAMNVCLFPYHYIILHCDIVL